MKNHPSFNDSVILGVDTHLDIHVGAVLSYDGKLLGTKVIQTNKAGYEELFDWVLSFGSVERAGIEGTGTYGAGLTRFLIKKGLDVLEINRPDRSKRRLEGKSDPLDAANAARTVLSGRAKAVPNCNPVPAKRCGSSVLHAVVLLRRKLRQSISCAHYW
ncbi:IS110 family transposase [Brenneria sp. KBI 447]|uniref:IS110 family transposase n=1 Tax=Brenneria izbisi TaxID=2939450 RepID=A0AA42C6G7_9GAMM|nr:IS110 family transposase [Brenneria izbisi]MCV9880296.1 IS110 family transposase [Brenneria izbisi]